MSKVDLEVVETLIINIVKAGLPAKISEINIDKNPDDAILDNLESSILDNDDGQLVSTTDGNIYIKQIPQDDYFDTFGDEVNNADEFLYYELDTPTTDGIGPATRSIIQMHLGIFFENLNPESGVSVSRKQAFRYSRALKEVIEEASNSLGIGTMSVSARLPIDAVLNENSPLLKVAGVMVSLEYA